MEAAFGATYTKRGTHVWQTRLQTPAFDETYDKAKLKWSLGLKSTCTHQGHCLNLNSLSPVCTFRQMKTALRDALSNAESPYITSLMYDSWNACTAGPRSGPCITLQHADFVKVRGLAPRSIIKKTKGSSPHSQQPATCPYPEPDQTSAYFPSQFLKINFNFILPSMPRSFRCSLSLRFPHQNPPLPLPKLLHTLPISFFLIWTSEWYLVRSTEHKAHCYVAFSTPLSPQPFFDPNILPSTLFSNILSLRSSLSVWDLFATEYIRTVTLSIVSSLGIDIRFSA